MDTYEKILVLFLSSALAVLLLLSIIVLVVVLKIVKHIKHITEKAEEIADKAESIGTIFQKAAGPVVIGRFLANMSDAVFNHSKKSRKSKE